MVRAVVQDPGITRAAKGGALVRRKLPPLPPEDPGLTTAERVERYFAEVAPRKAKKWQAHISPTRRGPYAATLAMRDAIDEVLLTNPTINYSPRQLFYQLVQHHGFENCEGVSSKVERTVCAMRKEGRISFERIVDRGREKHQRPSWDGLEDILTQAQVQFRRDYWAEQKIVPIICLEKDALSGVVAETVDRFGVQLWSFHGSPSITFTHDLALEIIELTDEGKLVVVHYLGDLDASGVDIEADARWKLQHHGAECEWYRLGLTLEDLDAFNIVRLPVKTKDTRSPRYRQHFGNVGAELDALDPSELHRRIRLAIQQYIDRDAWDRIERDEKVQKESLGNIIRFPKQAIAAANDAARKLAR